MNTHLPGSGAAAAGALTGDTLAANVLYSSLIQAFDPLIGGPAAFGSAAFTSQAAYDAAGAAAAVLSTSLQKSLNLSDLANVATARGNLGLGALAVLGAAPAGTLTGTTLAATVVASSLTSVGTLTSLSVTGDLAVNTNKFTVAAASGNTGVTGTLVVGGVLTANGQGAQFNADNSAWTFDSASANRFGVVKKGGSLPVLAMGAGGAILFSSSDSADLGTAVSGQTFTERSRLSAAGAWKWNAYGAGAITADASGNLTSVSDERLKTDIRPWTAIGLDAINRLQPIVHRWTPASGMETDHEYVGFGAQAVEAVLPGIIGRNAAGYRSFSDRGLIAALVNATQELSRRVVHLEAA